jgi:hypothetical protein
MPKIKRKFLSEFGVSLCSARWLLMPATQLSPEGIMRDEESEISKNCHIYLICERPVVSFDKNDFSYDGKAISGSIVYKIDGVDFREKFTQDFPLLDNATELKLSKYPHREIQTFNENGECVRYLPAFALSIAHSPNANDHIFRKLKVLYVGQAFGNGSRTAQERLKSHSTLQKILAEANYDSPDSEICVITVEYAPYRLITSFDGISKGTIKDKRDSARFVSIADNPLKSSEQISLAEAALIRYFQPHYNKIYKKKFPSTDLKVLNRCYQYDYSALFVEINTDELHLSLYSELVSPAMHHIANIDLVDHESRSSFFHMPGHDGTQVRFMPATGSANYNED